MNFRTPLALLLTRVISLACLLFVGALAVGLSFAQEEPEVIRLPSSKDSSPRSPSRHLESESTVNVREALGDLWIRRKSFLDKGDMAGADQQVRLMRDVVQEESLRYADEIAGAFLMEGHRYLSAGQTQRALQAFNRAKEFAPDRPDAFFAVSRTLWQVDRNLWGALSALFQGLRVVLKNPSFRSAHLGNLGVVAIAGSLLAAVAWCLLTAFRTARQVHHDFVESRARTLSRGAAQVVAWGLWLLPALLWFSGWWLLVYWLALGVIYLKTTERLVSAVACICLLAALPALGWITIQSGVATDPSIRFLLDTAGGSRDPQRIPILESMVESRPEELVFRFLLAQTYQRNDDVEGALREYRRIQKEEPAEARTWVNSGNLFFAQGQFEEAAEEYERATQLAPESALAFFNLHLAHQQALNLREADSAFGRARELDNRFVTTILTSAGGEARSHPLEARFTDPEILERLRWEPVRREGVSLARPWLDPLSLAGGLGLLACLVLPWGGARRGLGSARRCVKCGDLYCWRCQIGKGREDGHCSACRHLYLLKTAVPPAMREEREQRVVLHQRWRWTSYRLSSLFIPGAGQILGGRTWWGTGPLWVGGMSLSLLVLSERMLAQPQLSFGLSDNMVRIVGIGILASAWLAGNLLRFEPRSGS